MPQGVNHAAFFLNPLMLVGFAEFLLVAYLIYSLTKNVYNSYQVDKYIEAFETENAQIEEENRQKTEDYLYFTSEEYIDKIAKQIKLQSRLFPRPTTFYPEEDIIKSCKFF